MATLRIGEVTDEARDILIDHQRKIRLRCLQLGLDLRRQIRIRGKGHLVGRVERSGFDRGREAVALFKRRHLQRVHCIHQVIELIGKLRIALHIHPAHQHRIHRGVEVGARRIQMARTVVADAAAIKLLRVIDQLLLFVCPRRIDRLVQQPLSARLPVPPCRSFPERWQAPSPAREPWPSPRPGSADIPQASPAAHKLPQVPIAAHL